MGRWVMARAVAREGVGLGMVPLARVLSTVTRKFAHVFGLCCIILKKPWFVQFSQERQQVSSSKGPLERCRDVFVVPLELVQALGDLVDLAEVVGREDLPLDDGGGDLDLVQPTRMNGGVNGYETRMVLLESLNRMCAAV